MSTLLSAIALALASAAVADDIPVDNTAFAVVELFTSEGCSSCPPADTLLSRLHHEAVTDHRRVITLAYHVDYWDRLGWPDRFSDEAYTQRQRRYAAAFRNRSIYTPQMVVNGDTEFVGSKAASAQQAIDTALKEQPRVGVGLAILNATENHVALAWRTANRPADSTLLIALVQDDLTTEVQRGENAGRDLKHDGVVHQLTSVDSTDATGTVTIPLQASIDADHSRVVALVQDPKTMKILGAQQVKLATPSEK